MFLAVIRVRAVAAPLNNAYTSEEFESDLSDYKLKLLLTPTDDNAAAQTAALKLNIPYATVTLTSVDSDITFTLTQPESGSNSNNSLASVINEPFDKALFPHTSGVSLSQLELVSLVRKIKSMYRLTEVDSTAIVHDLFHIDGLISVLLSSLCVGASVTLPAGGSFSASTFWADMKRSNATWYNAPPSIHQTILNRHIIKPEAEYPCLRFIRNCSAFLDPDVLNCLEQVFGAPVLEANPMTEDGPHKPGSVVCIRDPTLTKRYKDNPETNKSTSQSGWFLIRDDGFSDEDGDIKELFKRRGKYLYLLC